MAQGGLNQVDRCAPVQSMRSVGMAQPMGGNLPFHPGPFCGGADNPFDHRGVQVVLAFATGKDRHIRSGTTPEPHKFSPCVGTQQNYPSFPAFAKDGNLPGTIPFLRVLPCEARISQTHGARRRT
jgi:hypothetical protein